MAIKVQLSLIKIVVCFAYGYNRGSQTQTVTLHEELFILLAIETSTPLRQINIHAYCVSQFNQHLVEQKRVLMM